MKKLVPYLIIVFTTCILFSPYLLGYVGITPHVGTNDNTDLQIPYRAALQQSLKQLQLPLWEPRISAGFPLLAEGQIGAFHPLNILSALLPVPAYYSVSLNIILTIIISSIGMYLFALNWLSKTDNPNKKDYAIFSALIWSYCGFNLNHFAHLNNINVLSMLPWQLLLIDKLQSEKFKLYLVPAFATTLALQVFSGHPQFMAYALIFNSLYFILTTIFQKQAFKKTILNSFVVGISIILGFGLGSVQLLPTLEFTQNSTRQSGITEESANFLSFRIKDLQTLVTPFYDFNHEPRSLARLGSIGWPFDERYSYLGLIPLILGILAYPFVIKNKHALIFSVLAIFFLLLSLGNQSPIGALLRIPPLNMFRLPAKFTVFFQFSMAILATYALIQILSKVTKNNQNKIKTTRAIIAILTLLTVIDTAPKIYRLYPLVKGESWFEIPQTVVDYKKQIAAIDTNQKPPVLGQDYNVQLQKQYLEQDPRLWNDLQKEVYKNNKNILPAFNMLYYDLPLLTNAINSAGLKVNWYSQIENRLFFSQDKVVYMGKTSYSDTYWSLARLAGAHYFIHDETLEDENANIIGKTSFTTGQDQIGLYQINNPLPFIQIPKKVSAVPNGQTYQAIIEPVFDPSSDLVLSTDQIKKIPEISESNFEDQIDFKINNDQSIDIFLQNQKSQFIFIRQSYYPGWTATVNDQPTPIYRANHAFNAIYLKETNFQNIKLRYTPTSFANGLLITTVSFVIYAVLIVASLVIRRRSTLSHATIMTNESSKN
jgi:hypothetical protein